MPRRSTTSDVPLQDVAEPLAEGAAQGPVARSHGDHWKKLLRPPKQAATVSVEGFVDEANRRLRADRCYREGTRFVVASDDGRPGGSTWEGPDAMKPVVHRIVQGLCGEFDVELPFFSDR